ncbi:MAG: hypothetical protein BWY80_00519 [Firmicutes bacterium ADurb.Bin456]|nr:MAG: hypothetical protein BWY80_00519 [Firmicutes bacterium ADurb.Bin456]
MGQRVGELVTELLDWDVKIETARHEQEQLLQDIFLVEGSLAGAQSSLGESRERLDDSLETLGAWVNFLYRKGPDSYLGVILNASSFGEFVERTGLILMVITAQSEVLDEVQCRASLLEDRLKTLQQAKALLREKNTRLIARIQDMDNYRAGREKFLNNLNLQSARLTRIIIEQETLMYRSLSSLQYLLQHLDSLPWSSLAPGTFTLAGNGIRLEFEDRAVNRILFGQGNRDLAGLSVQSKPGLFSITGTATEKNVDFKIEGSLEPGEEGWVYFRPGGMYLSGVPVSSEVLGFITKEGVPGIDFSGFLLGYCLSEIRPEEGKLVVFLTR